MEGCLFSYGNPLLDLIAETGIDFLKKYNLEANNAILADEKTLPIFQEMVKSFEVQYIPGGATLNAVRVAQWLMQDVKEAFTFTGCIGKDEFGDILEKKATDDGVKTLFMYNSEHNTGTCAVVVTGNNRSLVANLAAADHFKQSHLEEKQVMTHVEKAKFYYVAGFPLTASPESVFEIAQHSSQNDKTFALNLSAPFIVQFFKDPLMKVFPHVDLIFGNETEAQTFAKEQNFDTEDLGEIAKKMANLEKANPAKKRIAVITQGDKPTIVSNGDFVKEFPIIAIDKSKIVDSNGAGDAFVGGYLAQLVRGNSLEDCVRCAHYAANLIIQQSGVTLPSKPNFE